MRLIAIWVTVAAIVGVIFVEYIVVVPVVERFQESVNASDVNNTEVKQAMTDHIALKDRVINIVPYLIAGIMILWGLMWSQQRETITGVY